MARKPNWLTEALEERMYNMYMESNPRLIVAIKELLTAGESPAKIRKVCEKAAGKTLTANCVGFMVDYVNKQVKN